MPVLMAASTGMRRGEILAFAGKTSNSTGPRYRSRKSRKRRRPALPSRSRRPTGAGAPSPCPLVLVVELRQHKKALAEMRLKLGLGRTKARFGLSDVRWTERTPRPFSKEFAREAEVAGWHTSPFTDCGIPILRTCYAAASRHVVSARAGHANPSVTLNIYAHMLPDSRKAPPP